MAWTRELEVEGNVAAGAAARDGEDVGARSGARLSPAAHDRALELRDQLAALVAGRRAFLQRSGRDASLYPPPTDGLRLAYHTVMQGEQDVLRHLGLLHHLIGEPGGAGPAAAGKYRDAVRRLPDALQPQPPGRLGEVVDRDALASLETLDLLAGCGRLWELRHGGRPRVLEIGPGHGRLAAHLKRLLPGARYFCLDRPEGLLFSSIYLTTLFEDEDNVLITPDNLHLLGTDAPGFTFLPDYLFDDCREQGKPFDLILAGDALAAMTAPRLRHFGAGIRRLLAPEGILLERGADAAVEGLAEHLPFCAPLGGVRRACGAARLWAPRPVVPYDWLPSHEYVWRRRSLSRLLRDAAVRLLRRLGLL